MYDYILLTPIFLPILAGIGLLCMQNRIRGKSLYQYTTIAMLGTACLVGFNIIKDVSQVTLFYFMKDIPLYFQLDELGKIFSVVVTIIWIVAGFFGMVYMKKEERASQFFGFYLIVYGILIATHYAGNLITFYAFYECLTLLSAPLVLHNRTREAKMAALKYLFYSFCGAYMILFGLYFIYQYNISMEFEGLNSISASLSSGKEGILLIVTFLMILGFSVKAGMFPFHAWLWSAHPVAPAPASAVLSAVIVKTGVLGIIRVIFYLVGPDFIRGTWVQTVFLGCSVFTIILGSLLAYREDVLKKRLAYSTISQVSYILFGIALLTPVGMVGSLLHVVSHAMIKCTLFLIAGAIIHTTHKTRVSELRGIGKKMPVTMICFTIASLGLIGIPPTSGFVSKWYLAIGALEAEIAIWSIGGVIALLVSALLTAGYLLPIAIQGFFPGVDYVDTDEEPIHKSKGMTIPIVCLTVLALIIGIFPNQITSYFIGIVDKIM